MNIENKAPDTAYLYSEISIFPSPGKVVLGLSLLLGG